MTQNTLATRGSPGGHAAAASTGELRRPGVFARLAREPLLHFFVLGALIFTGDRVLNPPERGDKTIVVTRALQDSFRRGFDEDGERQPTPDELKAMSEAWVASEILYREGKALGVDRGDETIRDRIAFKLQLLIFSQVDAPTLTQADLRAWFEANRRRFDEPERVSFYISPATDEAAARTLLASVLAGNEPSELQQRTRALVGRPVPSLAPSFGPAFRDALVALPLETWSVLQSTEGWHLVRLDSRRPGEPAKFEDVQEEAAKIFKTEDTRKRALEAVSRLRANYIVRYEP